MSIPVPVMITLYDPVTNEAKRTYTCLKVSWRLFKQVNRLAVDLNELGWNNILEEHRNVIAALVLELFEMQFSYDELVEGSSLSEMVTVIQQMVNGMRETPTQNPLPPPPNESTHLGEETEWTVELEMALVRGFGWSLHDIDETDVASLKPFIDKLISAEGNAGLAGGGSTVEKIRAYADQVSWL